MNIEAKYDELYNELDIIFKEYNPCDIIDGKCIKERNKEGVSCCLGNIMGEHTDTIQCDYLGATGCTVSCIGCRAYVCDTVKKTLPSDVIRKIVKIGQTAFDNDIFFIRMPRYAAIEIHKAKRNEIHK